MSSVNIGSELPTLKDKKMLIVTHQHSGGFETYLMVVPGDFEAPKGTIGGDESVGEHPDLWEKYQLLISYLGINFDAEDSGDFLWCSEESFSDIKVLYHAEDLS